MKFVKGYKDMGINIEVVSPQNEPGYDQNYPSCLWDERHLRDLHRQVPGPGHDSPSSVKIMLGTLSNAGDNDRNDFNIANAALADSAAKAFCSVIGVQWGVLDKVTRRPDVPGPSRSGPPSTSAATTRGSRARRLRHAAACRLQRHAWRPTIRPMACESW